MDSIGPLPSPGELPTVETPKRRRAARARQLLLAALLLAMTLAAYLRAAQAGYIWDDDHYVTGNRTLTDPDGLRRIWLEPRATPQYYPLVHTTFWIEHHLWAAEPLGYHLTNILLHAASALLLWVVLAKLKVPGAWLAGALFAVHPVHVESVAWVTERKNVLSGLFYLLALLAYLRFSPLGDSGESPRGRWWFYVVALVLFAAALLSKTVTGSLPAAILLLVWWKRGRIGWHDVLALAPFFLLAAAGGAVTVWLEKHRVGASGAQWDLSVVERVLVAGRALWFYAWKLLWPAELVFNYERWDVDAGRWLQYLCPAAALGVLVGLWLLRRRLGRGALAGVLFFAGTLVPALGFFNVYPHRYSFVADHFQYHASVGLIALFAAGVATVGRRLPGLPFKVALRVACGVMLTALGILTWRQTHAYRDAETLWRDTLAKDPNSWMAMNNLGTLLMQRGRVDDALRLFQHSLDINPNYGEAHNSRGLAYAAKGDFHNAIRDYSEAISRDPKLVQAYNNRGVAYWRRGHLDLAIRDCSKAIELNDEYAGAYENRGSAYLGKGEYDRAIRDYNKAIELGIRDAGIYCNRANAYWLKGDHVRAISDFNHAVKVEPASAEAHSNRGEFYRRRGDLDGAIRDFSKAIELSPRYPVAYGNRAIAHFQKGRHEKSWADVHACRRLGGRVDPKFLEDLRRASGRDE